MEGEEATHSLSSSSDEDVGQRTRLFLMARPAVPRMDPNGDPEPVASTSGESPMPPNVGNIKISLPERLRLPGSTSYLNEAVRLQSFSGYPNSSIDVRQLAAAGFFYTKNEDIVRCAFCGVEVGRWEEGDNPIDEHRKWSKNCQFLKGAHVGNIPVDPSNPPPLPHMEVNLSVDECGLYGIKCRDASTIIPSLEKLGIQKRYDPVHPTFANLEARLESFSTWPVAMKLRPQELAEAGFFYTGLSDKTCCFQCGGGLKDWAPNDDPWREHALFFSKCSFVIQTKGREFVAEVLGKKPPTLSPEEIQALKIPKEWSTVVKPHSPSEAASSSSVLPSKSEEPSEKSSEQSVEQSTKVPSSKRIEDARACKICFSEEIGVAFLPCGHLVACPKCAASLSSCAVCRQPFNATLRVFLS